MLELGFKTLLAYLGEGSSMQARGICMSMGWELNALVAMLVKEIAKMLQTFGERRFEPFGEVSLRAAR